MGPAGHALMSTILKGVLGQFEGPDRRAAEATVWQKLSLGVLREVGKQLVWGLLDVEEGDDIRTSLHLPMVE